MKWKSYFLFAIFASFVGCNSQREAREKPEQKGEEVTIELCLFGSWDWKYTYEPSEVDGLKISIIKDSISFTVYRFDSPKESTDEDSDEFTYVEPTESAIVVDDITAKRIKGLADSLFVKKLLPIYDMKREVGAVLEAEDDCLDVECGREKTSIYIGSVYDKGMQHVGDCEVVYSRPFSLFVQLLYDVCAKNSGPKSEELYKAMLHEMKESYKYEILIPYSTQEELLSENSSIQRKGFPEVLVVNDQPYLGQPISEWKEEYGYTYDPYNNVIKSITVSYNGIIYELGISDNQTVEFIKTSDRGFSVKGYKIGDIIGKNRSIPHGWNYAKIENGWYAAWFGEKDEKKIQKKGRIQWFFQYDF